MTVTNGSGPGALHRSTLILMTAGAALGSAGIHCNQPLLPSMATSFGVAQHTVAVVPSLTQWGYAAGLALVVPLFDVTARRRLVVVLQLLAAVALAAVGASQSPTMLILLAPILGAVLCASQVLTPYAGVLSPPETRGHSVGTVLGGVLAGVLLGRVLGGFLGAAISWRAIYFVLALATLVSAAVLSRALPPSRNPERTTYGEAMGSIVHLVRTCQPLRRHALIGAMIFGSFMCFWSTYAFELSDRYGRGPTAAAVIALVGLGGALSAPRAGRWVDRGGYVRATTIGSAIAITGWLVATWGLHSVIWLAVGALIIDIGTGLAHGANLSALQRRYPALSGRVNAIYMVMYFIGGAIGSTVAPACYFAYGWAAVGALAIAFGVIGLALAMIWRSSLQEQPVAA